MSSPALFLERSVFTAHIATSLRAIGEKEVLEGDGVSEREQRSPLKPRQER